MSLVLALGCGAGSGAPIAPPAWNVAVVGNDTREEYLLPEGVSTWQAWGCSTADGWCESHTRFYRLYDDQLCSTSFGDAPSTRGRCSETGDETVTVYIYWM